MDTKQNLKPELKEVYDRIMNTDTKTSAPKSEEKTAEKPVEQKQTSPAHTETPALAAHTAPVQSSQPPQHVNPDQSFAFSSKDHKFASANESKDHPEKSSDKGQKISKEIIIALVVIFFIIYAGLCAVLLGVIQF